jgi:hypothetical protein
MFLKLTPHGEDRADPILINMDRVLTVREVFVFSGNREGLDYQGTALETADLNKDGQRIRVQVWERLYMIEDMLARGSLNYNATQKEDDHDPAN